MSTDGFEKVANIVGEEIDKAFKNVMERLLTATANGNKAEISALSSTLTVDDLTNFVECLGGAYMDLSFSANKPKGARSRFTGYELPMPSGGPVSLLGGEVVISIGGKWSF